MKERIKEMGYWLEDKLKSFCGEITPDKRLTIILLTLFVFTVANLYLTFTTIRNWGKDESRLPKMEQEEYQQFVPKQIDNMDLKEKTDEYNE